MRGMRNDQHLPMHRVLVAVITHLRCKADAMQEGYELKVQLMKPRDREYSTYGSLELIYHYRIPILNMNQEQCIYADIL